MMSKLPPARRVFLAHTTDLRPFTEAAKEAVAQAWDAYVEMATFPASPGSPVEQCRDMVGGCDVFVVIAGSHYGSSTAEATERSFVEMELDEAIRLEKPRLVFLLDGPPPTDPRQERFRSQLRDGGPRSSTWTVRKTFGSSSTPRSSRCRAGRPCVAVRNPYLGHVERIAPDRLEKRDQELAELAKYCTAPARAPYLWVRARAWAGKSALLAWFVLHPPPGVEVVSFFVTARLAGQDNRRAFAQALLAQLAHLLGEKEPAGLTEADLELRLSTMLNAAAAHCGACERRLVLVVDGLDEDRGIERDGYSIAALLPTHPVAGMRVVVSSRGHPPLPHEMSKHHPLRDPDVFWPLSPSAEAEVIRGDLRRDLDRLLTGTPLEQRLLGLVAAAGGGLTVDDLASLTDRKPRELDDVLGLPAWRVLERRPGRGDQDSYGLAHEELVVAVTERSSLQASRTRLHGWADGYEQLGWPTDTPRYLLDGYVRMLHDTDDAPRILALATTPSRHDLLLRTTGADAAALAEITSALEFFHRRSDLPALARWPASGPADPAQQRPPRPPARGLGAPGATDPGDRARPHGQRSGSPGASAGGGRCGAPRARRPGAGFDDRRRGRRLLPHDHRSAHPGCGALRPGRHARRGGRPHSRRCIGRRDRTLC